MGVAVQIAVNSLGIHAPNIRAALLMACCCALHEADRLPCVYKSKFIAHLRINMKAITTLNTKQMLPNLAPGIKSPFPLNFIPWLSWLQGNGSHISV